MHPIIDDQMVHLRRKYPDAAIVEERSGARILRVPGIRLPAGWTSRIVTRRATWSNVERSRPADDPHRCTILVYVPPGFPSAAPAHFWTEETIRDESGHDRPQCSNEQNGIQGSKRRIGTFFRWVLQAWDPNHCSLFTYVKVCEARFVAAFGYGSWNRHSQTRALGKAGAGWALPKASGATSLGSVR